VLTQGRADNDFLYAVISAISSSLELEHVLASIVGIAREATDCHAGFVYVLEGDRLMLRAASPQYRPLIGRLSLGIDEGVCGWVARSNTPAFIRDNALADARMKYVPELQEERFQSMVAVPLPARAGGVLGVIVLHTEAPRDFEENVVTFLQHTASLVAGAIENAALYRETRTRVDTLTQLEQLGRALTGVTLREDLYATVTGGARRLLGAEACHLYRAGPEGQLELAASDPAGLEASRRRVPSTGMLFDVLERNGAEPGLLVAPLVDGDDRLGLLCCQAAAGEPFPAEAAEALRAIGHQAAVALKKVELIERLTSENIVQDLFQALEAGSTAPPVGGHIDLERPHVFLQAAPARDSGSWPEATARVRRVLAERFPDSHFNAGLDRLGALILLRREEPDMERLRETVDGLAAAERVLIGYTGARRGSARAPRSLRESADALRVVHALRPDGGAACVDDVGAYRYLVHVPLDDLPYDELCERLELLVAYDRRRRTHLLDTLDQFLSHWRSPAAASRALFIHPNTLRQRLGRIEEVAGVDLDAADPLALALAVKLVRLRAVD
jgi:GAF domain-containing protein